MPGRAQVRVPGSLATAVLLLLAGPTCLAGPVQVLEEGGNLILTNDLVRYQFNSEDRYELTNVRLGHDDHDLLVTAAHFVYLEDGVWKRECGAAPGDKADGGFVDYEREILGDERRRTLRVTAHSDRLRLTKTFSLGADDTALRITYLFDVIGLHGITGGYTTLIWLDERDKTWLRPENEVREGRIVERIVTGPFTVHKVGNRPLTLCPETWVGCYDAERNQGILAVSGPEELLPFRAGEQGRRGFIGLSLSNLPTYDPTGERPGRLEGAFTLVPFSGDAEAAVQRAMRDHGKAGGGPRFPQKADSGRLLLASERLALWWDLPTSKVFQDEPAPEAQYTGVHLWAARNEYEPFQLVLRPSADLAGVRLECSSLKSDTGEIGTENIAWNALDYYLCEQPISATGFDGEVPDALLPTGPLDCPADRNQPFWVTVRVPAEAVAGEYQGTVRVRSGDEVLAEVAVGLTVWGFALPEQRSLSAFCPVWKGNLNKHYGRERTNELWPAYLENLAEHRVGMVRPEAAPKIKWDDEGAVASADFEAFDAAVEHFFNRYRLPQTTLSDFTLGWGHIPRNTRFGNAEDALSPLWRARCEGYARALAEHLRGKGWNDRIVLSLFDEPHAEYCPLIRDTVALLREVEPNWRFTFWGVYTPLLEGTIDVWTVSAGRYSPTIAAQARARGEEVWVYNPPGYCIDATAAAVRANWWWVWRHRIPAVFQWTITAWIEWTGSDSLWDPHRNASWILPGEDGPINTMRFELTREGLEDYEYLTLLSELVAATEQAGQRELTAEGRRVLARADEIAWAPESEKVAMLHTQDQTLLHEVRQSIGETIERLTRQLAK